MQKMQDFDSFMTDPSLQECEDNKINEYSFL